MGVGVPKKHDFPYGDKKKKFLHRNYLYKDVSNNKNGSLATVMSTFITSILNSPNFFPYCVP